MLHEMSVHIMDAGMAVAYATIAPGLMYMLGGAAFGMVAKFLKITVWPK